MSIETKIQFILKLLGGQRFNLENEKMLHLQMMEVFAKHQVRYFYDYRLNASDIIDFFIDPIGIEVKIKGSAMDIYSQCERYCKHEKVKALILVTNVSMGFPKTLNEKPCYLLNLGRAWL